MLFKSAALRLCAGLMAVLLLSALYGCGAEQQNASLTVPQNAAASAVAQTAKQPSTVPSTAPTTREPETQPTAAASAAFSPDDVVMTATPGSSCFSEVGYSEAHETLVVRFRGSGQRYCYFDVPASVWAAFRSADSLGRYYNTEIKGYYSCEKG